jgi:hypothetical protein
MDEIIAFGQTQAIERIYLVSDVFILEGRNFVGKIA